MAEEAIRGEGAIPSFLGYHGYPATICASVNDRDRARHPVDGARCCARATSCLHRLRRDRRRLARRRRGHACRSARSRRRAAAAARGHRGVDVARRGRGPHRRPAERHLLGDRGATSATVRLRHRRGVRRARHRHRDAHGAARPQLRPRPGRGPRAGPGPGPRGRADGQPRHAGTPGCSTTAGPS